MIGWIWAGPQQPELNETFKNWAAEAIWPGTGLKFKDTAVTLGILEGDALIAVVVYHDWDPLAGVIEFSGASVSRRWLTRPVIKQIFGFPFEGLGCQMVVTRNSAGRRQAHLHRILTAYGFRKILIPRLFGRDEDAFVFTLTDEEWRANKFNRR